MITHNALVLKEYFGVDIAAKYLKAHGFSLETALFILLGLLVDNV